MNADNFSAGSALRYMTPAAPVCVPWPVRIGLLSDLHLNMPDVARVRCTTCCDIVRAGYPGKPVQCSCGQSCFRHDNESPAGARFEGPAEAIEPTPFAWGDMLRSADIDLVLLAGDIDLGRRGVEWAAEEFHGLPVVMIAGNHEFYHRDYSEALDELKSAARASGNVTFLDRSEARFSIRGQSVRILGCTLWTDFAIYAADGMSQQDAIRDSTTVRAFQCIRHRGGFLAGREMLDLHRKDVTWLSSALYRPHDGTTIVMTHYPPIREGLGAWDNGSARAAAFACDISRLLWRHSPDLLVWGHTHQNFDERWGCTRLVSHPRGHSLERSDDYQPKIIELPPADTRWSNRTLPGRG